jgi:SET domain-containing protein
MARSSMKPIAEKAYTIKSSKIAGRGGFAIRDIAKGERLMEYLGERVSHAVADSRYDDYAQKRHHTFLFAVNRSVVIDAAVNGNEARFVNHSCEPNCEATIEKSRVFIEAIRPIAQGEELTYDYAYTRDGSETPDDEFRVYGCKCGSAKCRGTILAPLTKGQLKKRADAAKKRHHPKHSAARTGHLPETSSAGASKVKLKAKSKATSKSKRTAR